MPFMVPVDHDCILVQLYSEGKNLTAMYTPHALDCGVTLVSTGNKLNQCSVTRQAGK